MNVYIFGEIAEYTKFIMINQISAPIGNLFSLRSNHDIDKKCNLNIASIMLCLSLAIFFLN